MALSRDLGLNRNICQRLGAALEPSLSPLETLAKFPGPEGLQLFAEAVVTAAGRSVRRTPLLAAVEVYQRLVQKVGGSQAQLIRRIELTSRGRGTAASGDNIPARRKLFEAAADMLGYSMDTVLSLSAIRPMTDAPDFIEGIDVMGLMGTRSLSGSLTLVTAAFGTEERKYVPLAGDHPSGLNVVEEFCTLPLPGSTVEYADGKARTVVEIHTPDGDATDFVLGQRWYPTVHPALLATPLWWNSIGVHRPARRLVYDFYMHKSMATSCVPAVAASLWNASLTGNPAQYWHNRLPGKFTLQMLGPGLANAGTDAWDRHHELTTRIFELAGWPAHEFVGYRCDVPFPTWAATYYMTFEFAPRSAGA